MSMHRTAVNKHTSSKKFNRKAATTKAANVAPNPMRGGIRL